MDRDIWLLILGTLIGFLGSTLSTLVSYILENLRTKRQWKREDFLRAESRRFDEVKLARDFNMKVNQEKYLEFTRNEATRFCFLPSTKITLSNHETCSIENLKIGDALLSYDFNMNEQARTNVTQVKESEAEDYNGINGLIKVTSSHLFHTNKGWVRSCDITLEHKLYGADGEYIHVTKLEKIKAHARVINLETTNSLPFFAENVLVGTFSEKQSYEDRASSEKEEAIQNWMEQISNHKMSKKKLIYDKKTKRLIAVSPDNDDSEET